MLRFTMFLNNGDKMNKEWNGMYNDSHNKTAVSFYYLVEQDRDGQWSTNFTMYDTNIDDLMKRVSLKYSNGVGDRIYTLELNTPSPTGVMYRIIHPRDEFLDRFVCVIKSVV